MSQFVDGIGFPDRLVVHFHVDWGDIPSSYDDVVSAQQSPAAADERQTVASSVSARFA